LGPSGRRDAQWCLTTNFPNPKKTIQAITAFLRTSARVHEEKASAVKMICHGP
ncbi:hypothetical protein MKW92_015922, partial [Papaver armeniacum]